MKRQRAIGTITGLCQTVSIARFFDAVVCVFAHGSMDKLTLPKTSNWNSQARMHSGSNWPHMEG